MGISANAVMCGPSPYLASTPSRTGSRFHASFRMLVMNRNEGDINAEANPHNHAMPRDPLATRTSRYTPAIPIQ